jgi:MarR family transcriptional regulator, organic hydroperoxide resistance regulator
MVERLVGQGLIDRRQDADNRRQVRIRLTERGEELISELRQGILAEYRKLLARLPDAEQEDLVSSLETIARILGKINLDR